MSKLLVLLVVKAAVIFYLIQSGLLSLAPDEAQYWTWSQHLDVGYYSKPPAIAWQIKLTTFLFGDTELGVRFGALVFSFALSVALYFLAGFWAAVIMAFSPLGIFLSFAGTTDAGSIFFLTLAVLAVVKGPHYLLAGVFVFLGALYKWTAFILWPFVLVFLLFFPSWRRKSLLGGIGLSLLALLPALYWNMTHDFATFKHVFSTTVKATGGGSKGGNFFAFLGSQVALISPVYFALLLVAVFRKHKEKWLAFCASFTGAISLFFLFSFVSKIQPNWAAFLYPPGFAVLAYYAADRWPKGLLWLKIGTALSLVLVAGALLLPLPYKMSPFRQNLGWKELKPALAQAGYQPQDFLFSDKYQMTSLLSFYVSQKAYFFNVGGARKNQFSYWKQMNESEKGKTGYFVIAENMKEEGASWYREHYTKVLAPYFQHVEYQGIYPLVPGAKYALIFRGVGYLGALPPEKDKW